MARPALTATRHRLRIALTAVPLAAVLVFGVGTLHQRPWRIDLTPEQRYTLSERSREIVGSLPAPLRVRAFLRSQDPRNPALLDLLRQIETAGAGAVRTTVTDVNRAPAASRDLGVRGVAFVLEMGGTRRVVSNPNEDTVVGGLLELMRGRPLRIGWVVGHGEGEPDSGERRAGYGSLRRALETDNRTVTRVSLGETGVPEDLDVVVIVAPRGDLLPAELEVLEDYWNHGGALAVLVDSGRAPRLAEFLGRFGVVVGDDIVIDPDARLYGGEGQTIRLTLDQRSHPIVRALAGDPLFSKARSVGFRAGVAGVEGMEFLHASESSFAVPRAAMSDGEAPTTFEQGRDRRGPVPVGVEVRRSAKDGSSGSRRQSRMIVLGSGEFASNFFLDFLGNKDLVLNVVAWLGQDRSAVGMRTLRQRPGINQLYVSEAQGVRIYRLAVLAQPATVLLIGMWLFVRRRWQ